MDRRDTHIIDLLDPEIEGKELSLTEDDKFFEGIGGLISKGNTSTTVTCVRATSTTFRFRIQSEGTVVVPCDRCLADLPVEISSDNDLDVKLGSEYLDDGESITVPRDDMRVDLSQCIYEFIALDIPVKRVHKPGECDKAMTEKLQEYQAATRSGQEGDEDMNIPSPGDGGDGESRGPADKRWEALRKLKNNNN